MSDHDATQAIYGIIQMMLTIGFPLCMVAGWMDVPKKKTTRRRKKTTGQRPSVKAKEVKVRAKAKTWHIAPPLSDFEDRILADYFVKRNFSAL